MQTLKDKVVLITGANRGIGKSLVKTSLEKGASKIYATTRDLNKMPNFEDGRVIPLELDITNKAQVSKITEKTRDTQILINNAGILSQGNILEGEMSSIKQDMDTNLLWYSKYDESIAFSGKNLKGNLK